MNKLQTTSIRRLVNKNHSIKDDGWVRLCQKNDFWTQLQLWLWMPFRWYKCGVHKNRQCNTPFWGSVSIGFQTKDLFGQLHVSPSLNRQSRGDDEQLYKHRKSTAFGCVFYDENLTCKFHWNIPQVLNNTPRKWDPDMLRYRIFFIIVVSMYRYK